MIVKCNLEEDMFSIIIVNWNGDKLLTKCLQSLVNSTYKNFKLYIVDNASQDNSIDIIKKFSGVLDIDIIQLDKNYGFAPANNIAIDKAINDESDFIITLNNDIELKDDCLEKALNFINKNKEIDIFQILMINYFNRDIIDAIGMEFDSHLFVNQLGYKDSLENLNKYSINIDGACAGAAIYSKRCLKKVLEKEKDYFSSTFFAYYEDVDLALRLKNNGFKSMLIKDSIVYHMHSATGKKTTGLKEYYLTRNFLLYTKRNQTKDEYRKNVIFYCKKIIGDFVRSLLSRDYKAFKGVLKGFMSGIKELKNVNYRVVSLKGDIND